MSKWVNFAEVRQQVSLRDVIYKLYRIDTLTANGDKLVGPCPIHGGDSPRAFHADLERSIWHCFSRCKRGGNQLDFVAAKECISIREAALKLQEFFLSGGNGQSEVNANSTPGNGQEQPNMTSQVNPAPDNPTLKVKLALNGDHPHLVQDRGLLPETIEHFGVGYCSRGIMRGCIAIPIHDEQGNLVAYAGRQLKTQNIAKFGKYKLPKGFAKELVLFNYHQAKEQMATEGLILVEGFFSVLQLHQMGFTNAVSPMGSELSERQAELLCAAKEVIILFDGNEAGREGARKARELMAEAVPVRIIHLPDGLEPEDLPAKALRWLINGAQALDLAEVSFAFRSPPTT